MKILFYNGKIYRDTHDFIEAMIVENQKILMTGSTKALNQEVFDHKVDLEGKTVIPGFNDSHCHLSMIGKNLQKPDLSQCQSIDEIVQVATKYLQDHPKAQEEGFILRGWTESQLQEKRPLYAEDLDRISTEVPIVLTRACMHIQSANHKAMEVMNIRRETEEIPRGSIHRDSQGNPTGLFKEEAGYYILRAVKDPTSEEMERAMEDALTQCAALGITSIQSNDIMTTIPFVNYNRIRNLYRKGRPQVRYHYQFCLDTAQKMDAFLDKERDNPVFTKGYLSYGQVKMFKDGVLGGKTAYLSEPYLGEHNRGIMTLTDEEQYQIVKQATLRGLQCITHVIGDEAAKRTVEIYRKVGFIHGKNKLRHGLVHLEVLDPLLIKDIAVLGIPVFFQPIFLDGDIPILSHYLGKKRASYSYCFQTLKQRGIAFGFGSDAPIASNNPFEGIYCAVTRRRLPPYDGTVFHKEEALRLEEAIDAYTVGSAYLQKMEDYKGRLLEGYLADFILLNQDIFSRPIEDLRNTQVLATYIGGHKVYSLRD
ncbi:MAG: amidohydrolase [Tissierellia bacterium]|nr:amidohydrolase [Tissierellia bacterium]